MPRYFEIPTRSGRPFKERVVLSGVEYTLLFKWNNVSNCWNLNILDALETTTIISGLAIVTGTDLLCQLQYLPIGANAVLMALTVGLGHSPDEVPSFTNFGLDSHLYYVTA